MIVFFLNACLPGACAQEPHKYGIGIEVVGGVTPSCPVFIGKVFRDSPAARAGLEAGDRLISLDSHAVVNVQDASQQLTSTEPKPIVVEFAREGKIQQATVQREDRVILLEKDGWRTLEVTLVRADATDADNRYQLATEKAFESSSEANAVAFPDRHYPADKQLYYPGFEVFTWDSGKRVTIGGIEQGPAFRAGLRWGDEIVAINGVDPHGKSAVEIEAMLTSTRPSPVTMIVTRGATRKAAAFVLEQASAILTENQKKVVNGKIVPLWLPDEYLPCWR
jgi:predicted metalloprotease with PDZ domain